MEARQNIWKESIEVGHKKKKGRCDKDGKIE